MDLILILKNILTGNKFRIQTFSRRINCWKIWCRHTNIFI